MSDGSTGLGEHEAWYLGDVAHRLRRVPAAQRAPMLAVLEDNLAERPPSASRPELLEALGAPADYAGRLRDAGGFRALPPRRPRSAQGRAALVLMGVAIIGGSWFGWRWWTDDVLIGNYCGDVRADRDIAVERRSAAGATEWLVSYQDGADVAVAFCLLPHEQVKIVDVELVGGGRWPLFRPVGIRMLDWDQPSGEAVPFVPLVLGREANTGFYLDGMLGNCEHNSAGGTFSFNELTVTYEHHGRRRTAHVDLGQHYTFVSPPDAECPRPRDSGD